MSTAEITQAPTQPAPEAAVAPAPAAPKSPPAPPLTDSRLAEITEAAAAIRAAKAMTNGIGWSNIRRDNGQVRRSISTCDGAGTDVAIFGDPIREAQKCDELNATFCCLAKNTPAEEMLGDLLGEVARLKGELATAVERERRPQGQLPGQPQQGQQNQQRPRR